jgi:peptidyl-prolyl cis-trans isomerase C
VLEFSLDKPPKQAPAAPPELAGDLGIVGPPGHPRGANPAVPEALRAAVFKIGEIGAVLDEIVESDARFHVVRLTGRTDARDRAYAEAERTIRVAIVQQKIREREAELDRELRQKYPVAIDDGALAKLSVPAPPSGNP